MRKLVMVAFVSLDGVMQAPGGPEEDPSDGFPYGGWQFPFNDDEMGEIVVEVSRRAGGFLLGRRTYDIFAGYWPQVTDPDDPIASGLNSLPKYVVSTTLRDPAWHNTTVISENVPEAVRALKAAEDGDILIWGSSQLLPTLLAHDLVDEFLLGIYPVVLGRGKRLFAEGAPARTLRLTNSRRTSSGAMFNTYEPAGEVKTGEFGVDEHGQETATPSA
ncbi:dihydrofolate reductase family protein [Georgenia thermotolerans]|uniref:Dihydrofolate reductase n=1 Tax=Georgenia thermotolerans TaxID=527326 RepID=A0A7J5UTE4_9MICO|nr:dihydrofolate reductase family protein [Georgenia thermotolerans]KAE8765546.1 dihydrofolate reductase [Georgenia thermotolerans]